VDTLIEWLGGEAKTISFAILAGVVGFLTKSFYDLYVTRRKDKLDRVNQQLRLLYGPLYALNATAHQAWSAFRFRVRPGRVFFEPESPPTEAELAAWRLWMLTVFRPLHDEMVSVICKNADLFEEDDLPTALQIFLAHVAAYKVVFERWEQNDFSEHTSIVNYPAQPLQMYLSDTYRACKAEQRRFLGRSWIRGVREIEEVPESYA